MVLVTTKLGWTTVMQLRKKALGCLAPLFCVGAAVVDSGVAGLGAARSSSRCSNPDAVRGFSRIDGGRWCVGPTEPSKSLFFGGEADGE